MPVQRAAPLGETFSGKDNFIFFHPRGPPGWYSWCGKMSYDEMLMEQSDDEADKEAEEEERALNTFTETLGTEVPHVLVYDNGLGEMEQLAHVTTDGPSTMLFHALARHVLCNSTCSLNVEWLAYFLIMAQDTAYHQVPNPPTVATGTVFAEFSAGAARFLRNTTNPVAFVVYQDFSGQMHALLKKNGRQQHHHFFDLLAMLVRMVTVAPPHFELAELERNVLAQEPAGLAAMTHLAAAEATGRDTVTCSNALERVKEISRALYVQRNAL
jgi:hypothetical protein